MKIRGLAVMTTHYVFCRSLIKHYRVHVFRRVFIIYYCSTASAVSKEAFMLTVICRDEVIHFLWEFVISGSANDSARCGRVQRCHKGDKSLTLCKLTATWCSSYQYEWKQWSSCDPSIESDFVVLYGLSVLTWCDIIMHGNYVRNCQHWVWFMHW